MIERNYDNIPKELKGLKQWVCWKAEKEVLPDGSEHYVKRLVNPYNGKWILPCNSIGRESAVI